MVWNLIKCPQIFFPRKDKSWTKHQVMWHADVHDLCGSLLGLEATRWGTPTSHESCPVGPEVRQSVHALTCLSAPRTDSQTDNLSSDRAGGERNSITPHRTPPPPPPSLPPPPFPNIVHPFSLPPFIISFILRLHLCKSLHFRCIHTFSVSLCMSFPPSLLLPTSLCPSFPPFFCFLPRSFASYHARLLLYFLPSTSFFLYSLHPITVIHHSSISHHANRPPGCHGNHLLLAVCSPLSDWLARA